MSDVKFSAATSSIAALPEPDERAFATTVMLEAAGEREGMIPSVLKLPIPQKGDWWRRIALAVVELDGMTPLEAVTVAARRELRVEFALHPRRAGWHRRLNTRRWRFARDGAL